jgi:peptide subunit release factor 1 (eRF1)
MLGRLQQGVGAGGRAASGLEEVLDCLNEQRVETLLLDATFESAGAHCPSCGWLTARDSGACPADGTELQPCGDVVEPAIHRTLAQDADVIRLRDRPEMKLHRGIAALLRF